MSLLKFGGASFNVAPDGPGVFVMVRKSVFVGTEVGTVQEARELAQALMLAATAAEQRAGATGLNRLNQQGGTP